MPPDPGWFPKFTFDWLGPDEILSHEYLLSEGSEGDDWDADGLQEEPLLLSQPMPKDDSWKVRVPSPEFPTLASVLAHLEGPRVHIFLGASYKEMVDYTATYLCELSIPANYDVTITGESSGEELPTIESSSVPLSLGPGACLRLNQVALKGNYACIRVLDPANSALEIRASKLFLQYGNLNLNQAVIGFSGLQSKAVADVFVCLKNQRVRLLSFKCVPFEVNEAVLAFIQELKRNLAQKKPAVLEMLDFQYLKPYIYRADLDVLVLLERIFYAHRMEPDIGPAWQSLFGEGWEESIQNLMNLQAYRTRIRVDPRVIKFLQSSAAAHFTFSTSGQKKLTSTVLDILRGNRAVLQERLRVIYYKNALWTLDHRRLAIIKLAKYLDVHGTLPNLMEVVCFLPSQALKSGIFTEYRRKNTTQCQGSWITIGNRLTQVIHHQPFNTIDISGRPLLMDAEKTP